MLLRFSIALLCLAAVSACAIQRTDLSAVKEGATRTQVERVLGKPIKSVELENGRIDTYEYNRGDYSANVGPRRDLPGSYGYGGGVLAVFLLPIGAVAQSIRYEEQRAEIDIFYGTDGRVQRAAREKAERQGLAQEIREGERSARDLLDRSQRGDPEAQWEFAMAHAQGAERANWLCQSARNGYPDARLQLAFLAERGDHHIQDWPFQRDPIKAYVWYVLAEQSGLKSARSYRDELIETLTPRKIAGAKRLAAAWTPDSPCP